MSVGPPRSEQQIKRQQQRPAKLLSPSVSVDRGQVDGQGITNVFISRRSLLAVLVGGTAAMAAGAYSILPRRASFTLPIPQGQSVGPEYLAATLTKQPAPNTPMPVDGHGWSHCAAPQATANSDGLDLVLVVDTTGSMGAVLNDVKFNLQKLVTNLNATGGSIRVGVIAYKDTCDREMIRVLPLTLLEAQGLGTLSTFLSGLQASGGCDWPEKMDAALGEAIGLDWRGNVPSSIVVIADAPAHPQDEAAALAIADAFKSKLPAAQVSLIDTGSGGHPFMQAVPHSGGGQYVTYNGHILNSLFPAITGCSNVA